MARIRITFRSEVTIDADTLLNAKKLWEDTELFSADAKKFLHADFIEINSIEDADSYDDKTNEWDNAY